MQSNAFFRIGFAWFVVSSALWACSGSSGPSDTGSDTLSSDTATIDAVDSNTGSDTLSSAVDTGSVTDVADVLSGDLGGETGAACANHSECDDGRFCNGPERCDPTAPTADARGCVAASTPCSPCESCDEPTDTCVADCSGSADCDGDGHRSVGCSGDDCDDGDPLTFPGRTEVCDPTNHDEDCDPGTFGVRDQDGDGFADGQCCNTTAQSTLRCGTDCDDTNRTINPTNTEACNGLDDNCDDIVDEGLAQSNFVPDCDGDGFGESGGTPIVRCAAPSTAPTCNAPTGVPMWALNSTDCNDRASSINPGNSEACNSIDDNCNGSVDEGLTCGGSNFCRDQDGDGHGDATQMMAAVDGGIPPGYVPLCDDCDDANRSTFSGANELCDRIDNNCSFAGGMAGTTDTSEDADDDGHASVTAACLGGTRPRDDCDDSSAIIHTGAPELCDRIDNNCSLAGSMAGGVDLSEDADGDGHAVTGAACSGGYPVGDCNDGDSSINPGASETCDRIDSNCSLTNGMAGGTDPAEDEDEDGYAPRLGISCSGGLPRTDCQDTNAAINPGATEVCDRIDSNCSGSGGVETGEDADQDGHASTTASCMGGYPRDDCRDISATIYPGAPELCDRVDNDCSLTGTMAGGPDITEDADNDLHAPINATCSGGPRPRDDCNDTVATTYTGATERCDRVDNDCSLSGGMAGGTDTAEDADGDGYAPTSATCTSGTLPRTDCDDTNAMIRPGGAEVCDAADNDCNGLSDERATSCTGGLIACSTGACGGARQIASAGQHNCIVTAGGAVNCWGTGQGVDGGTTNRTRPVLVVGISDAVQLSCGSPYTCAVRANGAVACWGENGMGQLGDGTTTDRATPTNVTGLVDAVEVSAGNHHTCARRTNGSVVCWGSNGTGQLGDGTMMNRSSPVAVMGITDATRLATGNNHSCAIRTNGAVACWGGSSSGALGAGNYMDQTSAVAVVGLTDAVRIAAGEYGTCAVRSGGSVVCWGSGYLGNGTSNQSNVPVMVTGITDAADVTGGSSYYCVTRMGGGAMCWGSNSYGQLGNGTTTAMQTTAVAVSGLTNVVEMSAGWNHTCARLGTGEVKCWGRNQIGEVGDGTTTMRTSPVNVVP